MPFKIRSLFTIFFFLVLFFFKSNNAMAVPNCEEMTLQNASLNLHKVANPLYPQNENLYSFSYEFSGVCGFRSNLIYFPHFTVLAKLLDTFYVNQRYGQVEKRADAHYEYKTFYTLNQIMNGDIVYRLQHAMQLDSKHVSMKNQVNFFEPILKAQGEFSGFKGISWMEGCQQESAGWCFAWDGNFEILWEINPQDYATLSEKIKNTLAPKIFQETYLKEAGFIATAAIVQ